MPGLLPRAAIITAACVDGDLRIAAEQSKIIQHAWNHVDHPVLNELRKEFGPEEGMRWLKIYREAQPGGGYSQSAQLTADTIKAAAVPTVVFYSKRHSECQALKYRKHLTDPECAVMFVTDFARLELPLPPMYRAHVKINRSDPDKLEIVCEEDPMDVRGLVAHAAMNGASKRLCEMHYDPAVAAQLLGISRKDAALLAEQVDLNEKGLVIPNCTLS